MAPGALLALAACTGLAAATAPAPVEVRWAGRRFLVTVLAPDVARLRQVQDPAAAPLPEYLVVKPDGDWPGPAPVIREDAAGTVIATGGLTLTFSRTPGALTATDGVGRPLFADWRPEQDRPGFSVRLAPDEHLYGFGDKRVALDQRGQAMDLVNRDAFGSETNDSYKNVPFYISTRGYGLLLHTWWRTAVDAGNTDPNLLRMTAAGGGLDCYLFAGPTLKDLLARYTDLTGRPALLPRWFFGYHQAKASYGSPADGRRVARELRRRRLPCDAIYYDDTDDAVTAAPFIREIRDRYHLRLTFGLGNPMVKFGTPEYRALDAIHGLLAGPDGTSTHYVTEETTWDIGNVDYFSDAASDLFFDRLWRPTLEHGGEIGMVDFGELQYVPDGARDTFPSLGRSVDEVRNVYGLVYAEQLITRAARFAGGRKKPGRLVSMLRCGTAGAQRIGWTTTCDSLPTFRNMRAQLRAMLNLALCGFSHVGSDIGGWDGHGPDDVYARWFELGSFTPFMWSHGQGDHEPWTHGPAVERLCRAALERRYRLLPYLYDLNAEAHRTGIPAMRPLVLETGDPAYATVDDEFFLGSALLVAPALSGSPFRDVTLPAGGWTDWATGTRFDGPVVLRAYPAPLDSIPVFVRAGSILPLGPVMQYADEAPLDPLTLEVYPGPAPAVCELYEDDGESTAYADGHYATTAIEAVAGNGGVTVTVHPRDLHAGGDAPADRGVDIRVHRPGAGVRTVRARDTGKGFRIRVPD